MMTQAPIELMVAVLVQQADSDSGLKRLIELDEEGSIELLSAALLLKDDAGQVSLHAAQNLHEAEDALLGALTGGVLGLFGGIIGVIVGATAGGVASYTAGHMVDLGVSDDHLQALAQELPSGASAILVLIGHESAELAVRALGHLVASVSRFTLAVEAAEPAANDGG
jgi:uncharacterized membrane protein